MAKEDKPESNTSQQFVEVICNSSQKTRRFIHGVKAGYALTVINQKLVAGDPIAIYIEAAKEGEEPIVFAPDSLLRSFGDGWKLRTVADSQGIAGRGAAVKQVLKGKTSEPEISFTYIAKIFLALIFIFLLGALLTVSLETLPRIMTFISSAYHLLYSE